MVRLTTLSILFFSLWMPAVAGDTGILAKYNQIKKMPDDTNKLNALGDLVNEYHGNDFNLTKEVINALLKLALIQKQPKYIIRARLAKAAYYGSMNMFKDELDELQIALKMSEKYNFPLLRARGLIDLGIVYRLTDAPLMAIKYYREALAIEENYPEKSHVWNLLMNIGNFYDERGRFDSAFLMYNQSYQLATKYKDSNAVAYILSNMALTYSDANNLEKSREYLDKANAYEKYLDYGIKMQLTKLNARILLHDNKVKEAIAVAEKMKDEALMNKTFDFADYAADFLGDAYLSDKNYVKAIENIRQASAYGDSVLAMRKQQELIELQAKFETEKKELEISDLRLIKTRDNIIKIGLLIILLLVAATSISLVARIRTRRQKDLEIFEKNKRLLEAEKEIIDDKFRAAKMELEFNQKQLDTYTKSIIDKNMALEELKNDIQRLEAHKESFSEEEQLRQVSMLIDQKILTEDHWSDFKKKFETIHKGFFNKLREMSPDITNAELRLCCLIKLNLTSREMAAMLGISEDSVYKTRYRLRKKLMLEHDADLMEALNKI